MSDESFDHMVRSILEDRLMQKLGGRTLMHVRFQVQLGKSVIDIDKAVPLGDTTDETLAHIEALVLTAGRDLSRQLVQTHFAAMRYALDQDLQEEGQAHA